MNRIPPQESLIAVSDDAADSTARIKLANAVIAVKENRQRRRVLLNSSEQQALGIC